MSDGGRDDGGRYAPTHAGDGMNLRPFRAHGGAEPKGPSLEELRDLIGEAAQEDEEGFAAPILSAGAFAASSQEPPVDEPSFLGEKPEPKKGNGVTVKQVRREAQHRRQAVTEREKRRRAPKLRPMKLASIALTGVVVLAAALLTYFLLIVDSIEVHGADRFTEEEILTTSGLKVGRHIWLNRTGEAQTLIEQNPYIASAVVTRVYPDKLVINVVERTEAAVLVGMNAQAVIDSEGYVLSIGARADYAGLIKISGMGSGGYHVNQRLGEESDFNSRTLVTLLGAVYGEGLETQIESIDMSNPLSINMKAASGLLIHLGQPDGAAEKLAAFKTVLPTLKSRGLDASGTLDLSAKGDPVYSPQDAAVAVSPSPADSAEPNDSPGAHDTSAQSPQATPSPAGSASPGNTPNPSATEGFSG